MKYLARFKQCSGPMGQNSIDFYLNDKGKIIKHCWAMGGSSKSVVLSVPESIESYDKLIEGGDNPEILEVVKLEASKCKHCDGICINMCAG